jgi:hypothetical protein
LQNTSIYDIKIDIRSIRYPRGEVNVREFFRNQWDRLLTTALSAAFAAAGYVGPRSFYTQKYHTWPTSDGLALVKLSWIAFPGSALGVLAYRRTASTRASMPTACSAGGALLGHGTAWVAIVVIHSRQRGPAKQPSAGCGGKIAGLGVIR